MICNSLKETDLSKDRLIKKAVADNFSKAASCYDEKARIQQTISDVALQEVAAMAQNRPGPWEGVLDIGCATGRVTNQLQRYSDNVTGIDLSDGMIQFAKQESAVKFPAARWLVGDAEGLPVTDLSQDFVFSCMALQWLSTSDKVASECFRIISNGGEGLLTFMVDGSLSELTECWQKLQVTAPVNTFLSGDNWLKSFENVGFVCDLEVKTFVDLHANVFSLLHSIKDIGAGVVVRSAETEHLNKSKLISLNEVYKSYYLQDGQLPLSYKVGFLRIHKPFAE